MFLIFLAMAATSLVSLTTILDPPLIRLMLHPAYYVDGNNDETLGQYARILLLQDIFWPSEVQISRHWYSWYFQDVSKVVNTPSFSRDKNGISSKAFFLVTLFFKDTLFSSKTLYFLQRLRNLLTQGSWLFFMGFSWLTIKIFIDGANLLNPKNVPNNVGFHWSPCKQILVGFIWVPN